MQLKPGELHVYVDESGEIRPADEESWKRLKRMKKGKYFSFNYKTIKNYKFLKKFFAMLKLAFDNQNTYDIDVWFKEDALIGGGWCDTHIEQSGKVRYKVKSIAFDSCSQEEFEEVYNNVHKYLMRKYAFTQEFADELMRFK